MCAINEYKIKYHTDYLEDDTTLSHIGIDELQEWSLQTPILIEVVVRDGFNPAVVDLQKKVFRDEQPSDDASETVVLKVSHLKADNGLYVPNVVMLSPWQDNTITATVTGEKDYIQKNIFKILKDVLKQRERVAAGVINKHLGKWNTKSAAEFVKKLETTVETLHFDTKARGNLYPLSTEYRLKHANDSADVLKEYGKLREYTGYDTIPLDAAIKELYNAAFEQLGSIHFTDRYMSALSNAYKELKDLLVHYEALNERVAA